MPLFPDEFPFKKPAPPATFSPAPIAEPPAPEPAAQPAHQPIMSAPPAQPLPVVLPEPVIQNIVAATPDEPPIVPPAPIAPVSLAQERRRSPRQALLARALVRNEIGNAPGWKVELLNVSMLGIRFRSSMSMIPGDKAFVKLEVGPLRWNTKLRVVHCAPLEDGLFSIGCEFVANELARPSARAAA